MSEGVRDHPGDPVLPRHRRQRAQIRNRLDVRKSILDTSLHWDDIAHRRGVEHGPTKRHAMTHHTAKLVDENVTTSVDADEVGVGGPHDINST